MKKVMIAGIVFMVVGMCTLIYYYIDVHKPSEDAKVLLNKGISIYEMGDKKSINRAIDLFRNIIVDDTYKETDSWVHALYHMAYCYEKLNLTQQAYYKYVSLLSIEERISPRMINEIRSRIAHLKLKYEYSEEGLHQLFSVLSNSTDKKFRSRIYSEIGQAYMKKKQYRKALKKFNFALYEYGENEEAMIGKARSYKRLGQYNKAYDLYEKFLKYFGARSTYAKQVRKAYIREVYSSGMYFFRKGKYNTAIRFYKRLLNFYPHVKLSENCYYWIGESYFKKKYYVTALKYFGKALSNSYTRKNQAARIKRGYSFFMLKKYDLAAREFQIYLNHYPRGRYRHKARKWKRMTKREIIYRMNKYTTPETREDFKSDDGDDSEITGPIEKDKTGIKPVISSENGSYNSITEL